MEAKSKKHREQFKLEAVRLLEARGERTVADVAAALGVAESLLHSWKKKYGSAPAQVRRERGGETAEEGLKRLRREISQVKQERDILKNQWQLLLLLLLLLLLVDGNPQPPPPTEDEIKFGDSLESRV